jgi:alkyl hydroperoxide reductase subunit D
MEALKDLVAAFPEAAKDLRLNLTAVLQEGALDERRRFGVALAAAHAVRRPELARALRAAGSGLADDAAAAAALMAMNNVYYRFRHMVGKPGYAALPAKLRMGRMASPKTTKADFELMALAVSAIHGCEACVRAHEASLVALGLSEAEIHDAARIAAVIHGAAAALALAEEAETAGPGF